MAHGKLSSKILMTGVIGNKHIPRVKCMAVGLHS